MDILNQNVFFIKFQFINIWKNRDTLTPNQQSTANRKLREFFMKLHMMPLDIGKGNQHFYLVNYYKLITEIDNYMKNMPTYNGRKRKDKIASVSGLMFEMKWMGSILDIDEATQRMVDIAETIRKQINVPYVEVFLGAKAIYYANINKPK